MNTEYPPKLSKEAREKEWAEQRRRAQFLQPIHWGNYLAIGGLSLFGGWLFSRSSNIWIMAILLFFFGTWALHQGAFYAQKHWKKPKDEVGVHE